MGKDYTFMELVEIHERRWGTRHYPGRAALQELLDAPIVAVWACKANFTFEVYQTVEQINERITGLLTGRIKDPDNRKLVRVFHNRQAVNFALQVITLSAPPQQQSAADRIKAAKRETPLSSVTRGATYQPQTLNDVEPYPLRVIAENPQRAPRIVRIEEKPIERGSYAMLRPPRYARNDKLPGRKRDFITRKGS